MKFISWRCCALLPVLLAYAGTVSAIATYAACQSTAKLASDPTALCPKGTKFVSQTNRKADFKSVQAAVMSLPNDTSSQWILIDAGEYHEPVNVSRIGPTTLLGRTSNPESFSSNLVTIYNTSFINQTTQNAATQDNADSAVLTIAPNKYASWTGAGFYGGTPVPIPDQWGCSDFRAYNINFENRAADHAVGPALALSTGFANSSFYACSFKSYQDTLFIGKNASTVFRKSEVLGSVDYIYGFGTAYFDQITMGSRGQGSVTAWKGTPNYTNTYGAYFSKSSVIASPDADSTLNLTGKQNLGRPWNNLSTVVYMDTYMDSSVDLAGFTIWQASDPRTNLVYYAEAGSHGPGWNKTDRVSFDHILPLPVAAANFSVERIFGGVPTWVDWLF